MTRCHRARCAIRDHRCLASRKEGRIHSRSHRLLLPRSVFLGHAAGLGQNSSTASGAVRGQRYHATIVLQRTHCTPRVRFGFMRRTVEDGMPLQRGARWFQPLRGTTVVAGGCFAAPEWEGEEARELKWLTRLERVRHAQASHVLLSSRLHAATRLGRMRCAAGEHGGVHGAMRHAAAPRAAETPGIAGQQASHATVVAAPAPPRARDRRRGCFFGSRACCAAPRPWSAAPASAAAKRHPKRWPRPPAQRWRALARSCVACDAYSAQQRQNVRPASMQPRARHVRRDGAALAPRARTASMPFRNAGSLAA
jgi:hypothetical protein